MLVNSTVNKTEIPVSVSAPTGKKDFKENLHNETCEGRFDKANIKHSSIRGMIDGTESMKKIVQNRIKGEKLITNDMLVAMERRNLAEEPTSPTFRLQTSYEATKTTYGMFSSGNKVYTSITLKYVDRKRDEDCYGRFFINGTDFFKEASKLYAQDKQYLDHKSAWLPKDISRYAKDCTRFFGGDESDTSKLESQIDSYIRNLADGKDTSNNLLSINGVDFGADKFVDLVSQLKRTLTTAKISSQVGSEPTMVDGYYGMPVTYEINTDELAAKISGYTRNNLTREQSNLVLASKSNWTNYSVWASTFARDEGVFRYM